MTEIGQAIARLSPLLKLYPWVTPAIVILGILSALSEGFGISLFIPLLQNIDQSQTWIENQNPVVQGLGSLFSQVDPERRFWFIAIFIFLSIVIKNIISYSNSALFAWFDSRVSQRLRSDIFNQLLHVGYSFLEKNESSQLLNTLATETWQTSRALGCLVGLITATCTIAVFAGLLMLLSWQLTLIVAIALGLVSLTIQWVTRQVEFLGQEAVQANRILTDRMWQGLGGMRVIRAFGRESYEQDRFDRASENVRSVFLRLEFLSQAVHPLSEVLSALVLMGILVIALAQDQAALPTLLTFLFVLYRLQPQVKQLDGARVGLLSLASSVREVMALRDRTDKPYIQSGWIPCSHLQQGIQFKSVSFRYNPQDLPAVQDISIEIPQGKTTALVGPSGAGKSTLIELMCRFYEPETGTIEVDGHPLAHLNLSDWRSRIAIVSQDIYIFSTTIRENIAYGQMDATDDEVAAAAKLANAHGFISQLPYGYETRVGDRGMRLSGGQRQRIALARAIIRNPDILILDEATNALDSISENLIQEALDTLRRDRTVVVIAHRLSTIEQADQIVVLEQGRVVERGNLQHLLKLNGLFAKLYALQYRTA